MNLIGKIKKYFEKESIENIEDRKEIPPIPKSKYENMIVIAPPKTMYEGDDKIFYITVYDENYNPIKNEKITIKLPDGVRKIETDEGGVFRLRANLTPGVYVFDILFPNGDYSQSIESRLEVKESSEKPSKPKTRKKQKDSLTTIYAPNMKMYSKKQTSYYVKLKDINYKGIEGEEIIFDVNDEKYVAKTDEKGIARLNLDFRPNIYQIKSEYEGNEKYDGCKANSVLKVLEREEDKQLMIEVNHLSMEFKITKDKIDTLKEFIIRSIKRNKEEHEKIKVLDDISFKVYKGDRLGILGFNGAGKSTLLKIMSGIYEPTSGSITTYGKIAPLLELGAGFDKNYTGKNNIFLNGAFLSMDEKFIKEKYDEIVEFSELGEFINYPIKNYSSGMKSKLGFSVATTINPDILIIDEILSVGDIKFRKKSSKKINSMMKDGVTVLLVSHSISQIRKICDRCIWLQNGKIVMDGESNEVCNAYIANANSSDKKK